MVYILKQYFNSLHRTIMNTDTEWHVFVTRKSEKKRETREKIHGSRPAEVDVSASSTGALPANELIALSANELNAAQSVDAAAQSVDALQQQLSVFNTLGEKLQAQLLVVEEQMGTIRARIEDLRSQIDANNADRVCTQTKLEIANKKAKPVGKPVGKTAASLFERCETPPPTRDPATQPPKKPPTLTLTGIILAMQKAGGRSQSDNSTKTYTWEIPREGWCKNKQTEDTLEFIHTLTQLGHHQSTLTNYCTSISRKHFEGKLLVKLMAHYDRLSNTYEMTMLTTPKPPKP